MCLAVRKDRKQETVLPRRAAQSVKLLSTAETSCITNTQRIERNWRVTVDRLVENSNDLSIGVVNKLDRRRRRYTIRDAILTCARKPT